MSRGAYLLDSQFGDAAMLESWVARLTEADWTPIHAKNGPVWERWREVRLHDGASATPVARRLEGLPSLLEGFPCKLRRAMFYGLAPGTVLPRHRDLNGARNLGSMRLHLPAVTHEKVHFTIGGRRLHMKPGELWALDTSWPHSVANESPIERVHLVLNVEVGDWLLSRLPRQGLSDYVHQLELVGALAARAFRAGTAGEWDLNRKILNVVRQRLGGKFVR